jgi:SWIRM-associated domain at the N-terminal
VVLPFGPKGDPDDGSEYSTVIAAKCAAFIKGCCHSTHTHGCAVPQRSVSAASSKPFLTFAGNTLVVTPTPCRCTARRGPAVRVHYWYQPDSYDEWIPASAVSSKEVCVWAASADMRHGLHDHRQHYRPDKAYCYYYYSTPGCVAYLPSSSSFSSSHPHPLLPLRTASAAAPPPPGCA